MAAKGFVNCFSRWLEQGKTQNHKTKWGFPKYAPPPPPVDGNETKRTITQEGPRCKTHPNWPIQMWCFPFRDSKLNTCCGDCACFLYIRTKNPWPPFLPPTGFRPGFRPETPEAPCSRRCPARGPPAARCASRRSAASRPSPRRPCGTRPPAR